jgi:two-component system CheB/CheR fusion protein
MSLLRDGISSRVHAVIQKARENADGGLAEEHARVRRDDGYHPVTITVRPLSPAKEKQLLLVSFADQKHDGPLPEPSEPMPADETVVRQLEMELKNTRSQMAAVISDLETANEELKASNEEIMSMNEEFQSTNEELETSREELQSLNEELTTVNNQLEEKVQELETANNDLRNLLASSEIAVIFLDSHLRIKRYTESTKKVLRLIPSDVGRPVSDIAHTFEDFDLPAAVQEVSDSLNKNEHQVRSKDNRWYTIRILPYRTEENKVEGVVLTFSDVTGRKNED